MNKKIDRTGSESMILISTDETLRNKQRRWEAYLIVSLAFLAASAIFGLSAFALPYLGSPTGRGTDLFARVLFALVFPAALFVGHCLDKLKETELALRLEAARESGFRQLD